MIDIVFDGYCEGCRKCDLYLIPLKTIDVEGNTYNDYEIHCEHEGACERLEEIFKNRSLLEPGGEGQRRRAMNHDYTHCSDYSVDCPKECFRARLTNDLEHKFEHKLELLKYMTVSWAHFKGTSECERKEAEDD